MKTAEELLKENGITPETVHHNYAYVYRVVCDLIGEAIKIGYEEAIRWRDPKEELPDCDTQVMIKGGILKPEIGLDFENIHCTGYYCDGVWDVSPTDYSSIEIENPMGWRPIE